MGICICDVCIILNSVYNYLGIGTTIIPCVILIITVSMMSSRYCMVSSGCISTLLYAHVHVDIFSSVLRDLLNRLSFLSSHQPAVPGPRVW